MCVCFHESLHFVVDAFGLILPCHLVAPKKERNRTNSKASCRDIHFSHWVLPSVCQSICVHFPTPKGEMVSCEEKYGEKLTLVQPDPVALEINRLQNQLKGSYSVLFLFHHSSLSFQFLSFFTDCWSGVKHYTNGIDVPSSIETEILWGPLKWIVCVWFLLFMCHIDMFSFHRLHLRAIPCSQEIIVFFLQPKMNELNTVWERPILLSFYQWFIYRPCNN